MMQSSKSVQLPKLICQESERFHSHRLISCAPGLASRNPQLGQVQQKTLALQEVSSQKMGTNK
jgi:hypothetical protein